MQQMILQLATQGGLQLSGQQVGAFAAQIGAPEEKSGFDKFLESAGGILAGGAKVAAAL
jgi:hypothetical protein